MAKAKKTKVDAGDADLAKQKIKVEELLAQDRQKLLMKMPFIGALLMRLDLVPVRDERLDTAATDGDRIYVDIDFYMKLKSDERLFVLAHEAWHCALIHFMRRGDRNKEQFNIAADLEIHFILTGQICSAPDMQHIIVSPIPDTLAVREDLLDEGIVKVPLNKIAAFLPVLVDSEVRGNSRPVIVQPFAGS